MSISEDITRFLFENMEPIDGSPVVSMDDDGMVTTEDGRQWHWKDTSYCDSETGHNWVPEGEWVEYKSNRLD